MDVQFVRMMAVAYRWSKGIQTLVERNSFLIKTFFSLSQIERVPNTGVNVWKDSQDVIVKLILMIGRLINGSRNLKRTIKSWFTNL